MYALVALTLLLAGFSVGLAAEFEHMGDCEDMLENHYLYKVEQSHFDEGNKETIVISCNVVILCEAAGKYGDKAALLYSMTLSDTQASGNLFEKGDVDSETEGNAENKTLVTTFDDTISGWFKFVQTEDGSIPAIFHPNGEDISSLNFKKSITSAFQANFMGTSTKVEADPQSIHVSEYTYEADVQDKAEGVLKMHRRVTSKDVEDYASHIPGDVVALDKEEDIVYKKGVLTHSAGVSTVTMMPHNMDSSINEGDVEGDSLEAEAGGIQKKRDISMVDYSDFFSEAMADSEVQGDMDYDDWKEENNLVADDGQPTYDDSVDINHFKASGTYSLDLIAQRRVLRRERGAAVNHLELPEATESTLIAHIDHTQDDIDQIKKLHSELGVISTALQTIHKDPKAKPSFEREVEKLISLEAKLGPLSGYHPAINDVISYLMQITGSTDALDLRMRLYLYFLLSLGGSVRSQMALLTALDNATDDEEQRSIIAYIAFTEHLQPEMASELEKMIGSDPHSTDPLLLAYGALVAKVSPDLQYRMTLFLLNRLPLAETNTSSLIHHILSLGNTESFHTTSSLTEYLQHSDNHVQLSAIYALRYATSDNAVQKALTTLVSHTNVSDEHLATVLRCLLYGIEHASNTHTETPFNVDLAMRLSTAVISSDNEYLQQIVAKYLQLINSVQARNLLEVLLSSKGYSNTTRLRRGTYWAENNAIYNLVSPLATRQRDSQRYRYHKAYIWGKKFGVKDGNVQVAAGGFIGAGTVGDYKIFGRAIAVGQAFGKTKTALDFLVHREKSSTSATTKLYAQIIGKTLLNINEPSTTIRCRTYSRRLYSSSKYTLFDFGFSVFVYVALLRFNLAGYVRLNTNLEMQFCQNTGSITGAAGLPTTITMELQAGATANLLAVVRGGISVSAVFNYQLTPELSTKVCYTDFRVRTKNCLGVYHQWTNNKINLDVWYQWRSLKWCRTSWGNIPYPCGFDWGSRKRWDSLSTSWNLSNGPRRTLWARCDPDIAACNDYATSNAVDELKVSLPVSNYVTLGTEQSSDNRQYY